MKFTMYFLNLTIDDKIKMCNVYTYIFLCLVRVNINSINKRRSYKRYIIFERRAQQLTCRFKMSSFNWQGKRRA